MTEVEVLYVERLPNSVNGNPRWVLHTLGRTYTTEPDIAGAYNLGDQFTGRVKIKTNNRGKVTHVIPVT